MQCAPPKVREFETGAEMIAEARAVRARLRALYYEPPAVVAPPLVVDIMTQLPMTLAACPDADETIPSPARLPRCQEIIKRTARHYNVSVKDLMSERRTANIVRPRQIAAYLCCTITPRSLPFIGRLLGDRDHTTVLHARNKIARLVESNDPDVASAIAAITGELRGRFTF